MLTKRVLFLGFCLLFFIRPFAQVNLQTGSAVFNLPIFNWKDDKGNLTNTITLSYNSGNGLKVNEVASDVGQGWNLFAGGFIARMQVGEPDDQQAYGGDGSIPGGGTDHDIRKYPAGYLYTGSAAYNGCPLALTKYPIYGSRNIVYTQHNLTGADRTLDYFSFQFNGKSGMFILDTAMGDHGDPLGDTKMKITFQRNPGQVTNTTTGIRTTISSFTIQDEDGVTYKFTQPGLTEVLKSEYCDPNFVQAKTQPKFKGGSVNNQSGFVNAQYINPWIITSWYLTEIDDGLTGRKIMIKYRAPYTINNKAGADISYNQWHDYIIISNKVSITQSFQIDSIYYPDGHLIKFKYGAQRYDLAGEQALSAVDILYNGRYESEYQFNTSYFILNRFGTPTTPYQKSVARLCLRSVKKIGVDLKEDGAPYLFDYYLGSNADDDFVPPPFFYARDIWGYYNGHNSISFDNTTKIPLNKTVQQLSYIMLKGLCFLNTTVSSSTPVLNAKSGFAQNGLLRQIIYPTGGTISYTYAQNTGAINGTTMNVGGVHVSQTSATDGGFSNGCANPLVTQYSYVLAGTGASSLWGLEMPANFITQGEHYAPEYKTYQFPFSCGWKYQYPGILAVTEAVSLSDFQKFMIAIGPVLTIIGVITDILDVVNVCLGTPFAVVAVIIDIIGAIVEFGLSCFADNTKDGSTPVYYNSNLNDAAPLPTQFKRVEVTESPGTSGKTIHEFTSNDDYGIWEPTNPDFVSKQRFAPWAYGLPKAITVVNAAGDTVKQTINSYDSSWSKTLIDGCFKCIPNSSGISSPWVNCKCGVITSSSQRDPTWADPSQYNLGSSYQTASIAAMNVDFYGFYTGRFMLSGTIEKLFSTVNPRQYSQISNTYYYNNYLNFEVYQIATTESNGDISYKNIKYNTDYTGGVMPTLLANNIVATPVSITNSVSKANSGGYYYLNEKVTEFSQLANGDIKPSRLLEQRFTQPQSNSNMTYYGGPGSNISAYKIPQVFTYDANGNQIGSQDEGLRNTTNIYDYNDKFVSAVVINADPVLDHCAYSSFESQDLSRSGWTLTGATAYVTTSGITGSNCFALSSGKSFSANLNTAKAYIVSFWSTSGMTVTGGATLSKSGPSINGFTYYEYSIAQGTTSVSISGAGNIDELRLYPKNARMTTMTYDPIMGKTSDCDANNRITYYSYDNLGRLQMVKDENMNIVKMYEYNTISPAKQNGCPGSYSSHMLIENFARNNCSVGRQGSDVPDTIPAGRYTSVISQADADVQAELDALTNGFTHANAYGTCDSIYCNVARSETDSTTNCPEGQKGGWVTYSVPARRYCSTLGQGYVDTLAMDDIAANAAAYANAAAQAVCTVNTAPDWQSENPQLRCETDANGNKTGNQQGLLTDINPNSPTYNTQQWKTIQTNTTACPPTTGSPPSLNSPTFQTVTTTGVITGTPGTQHNITITLNSSTTDAHLTGNVGGSVNLSGSGNHSQVNAVTIPAVGYISWTLNLSGTKGTNGYVSSNIQVN